MITYFWEMFRKHVFMTMNKICYNIKCFMAFNIFNTKHYIYIYNADHDHSSKPHFKTSESIRVYMSLLKFEMQFLISAWTIKIIKYDIAYGARISKAEHISHTLDCQIEVYTCLFILHFLPPWTHLIRACTLSILGSNATLHVHWDYCGVSRLVLTV